jgi:glycosyltransferase involved in cell wall biosynthesis
MPDTLFGIIAAICGAVYMAGAVAVIFALGRIPRGQGGGTPLLSVVIAARNEASTIGALLEDLARQSVPGTAFEVIVADDRSSDGTGAVIREYADRGDITLRSIRIDETPPGISPKKHALTQAIGIARGDIILQTDADCRVPSDWISGMSGIFSSDVDMVIAPAPYRPAPGALNAFIRHEYLWNAALMLGSLALGMPSHASGRCLGFRRESFLRIGGYGDSARIRSGDDTLLLHRFHRAHGGRIVAVTDPSVYVTTDAPATLGAFIRQRIRHFSTGRLFDPGLLLVGVPVYGFHIGLIAGMVLAPWWEFAGWVSVAGFGCKIAVDALAALRVSGITGLKVRWILFPVLEAASVCYLAVLPILGLIVPVRWKETI